MQRQLRVAVKLLVIDQFAHRTLATVDLLQYLLEVGHRRGGFPVESVVLEEFADCSLAGVGLVHDLARLPDRELDLVSGALEVGDGTESGVVKGFIVNQFADGAFALGNLGGDGLYIGNGGSERSAIGFEEISERPQQVVNFLARKAAEKLFGARSHVVNLLHDGVEVRLLFALEDGALSG